MKKKSILVKFTVVAAMIGFFSPSVTVETNVQSSNSYSVSPIQLNISLLNTAEARRGGGGGARRGGGGARRSSGANRGGNRAHRGGSTKKRSANRGNTHNKNKNRNTNRNKNVNKNKNKNVNRNVNKNVNVNVNNNRYYGGGHRGGYGYYRGAPILAFATGMALGSVIAASTIPSTCTTVVTGGVSYRRCDNSYYEPFYEGDTLVYRAVASPY